jgi:TetR/AcrR family transcriptional repressor of nem operon
MKKRIETSEWPETKRRIVEAGVGLMRAQGYNATSLDDICAEAKVTKGGFFHYFRNKEEIARAAVEDFAEAKVREFQDAPFRKLADPLERVFGRLDYVTESACATRRTKGCLIGTLAQELAFSNTQLRQACGKWFAHVAADVGKDLAEAKALHAPRTSFDPQKLAALYVTIIQGSILMAKTSENNDATVDNVTEFRRYLEFLFGKKSKNSRKTGASLAAISKN